MAEKSYFGIFFEFSPVFNFLPLIQKLLLRHEMFSLLHLYRCIQKRIQDPAKYLKYKYFFAKISNGYKMLTNFEKGSIINIFH